MKKVLSLVLVLALVLGSFSMAFAAETKTVGTNMSDVAGNANEGAIVVANDLGIVTGYNDGTFKPANAVTRAEFAAMMTRALAIPETALKGFKTSSFKDVASDHWAVAYLGYCNSKGIMTGYEDGTARPNQTITVNEAITMICRSLGYTAQAKELVGSWPANYIALAQNLKLYKDLNAETIVDRASAAQIVYNALTLPLKYINADGDTVNQSGNPTMLTQLDGDVANNGKGLVLGTGNHNVNTVKSLIDITSFMGSFVKVFLDDDGYIIAVEELSKTMTGTYDDDTFTVDDVDYDMSKIDIGTYAYNENGIGKVYNPQHVSNGAVLAGTSTTQGAWATAFADGEDYTLAVEIDGKTITSLYSVIEWDAADLGQFAEGDLNIEKAKITVDNTEYKFEKDKNGDIDMSKFSLVGVSSLDKIAVDNVVEVYTTSGKNDKNINKIAVGTKTITGACEEKVSGKAQYYIDGTKYSFVGSGNAPTVGESGTAYLTYDGDIAVWTPEDVAAGNYAIVTNVWTQIKSGKTVTMASLFLKDGTEPEFDLTSSTKFVGTQISTVTLQNVVTNMPTNTAIVKYTLDSNGKIAKFTADAAPAALGTAKVTKNGDGLIGNNSATYKFGTSPVVFLKNTSGDWTVSDISKFQKDDNITFTYAVLDANDKVVALASTEASAVGHDDSYGFINTVTTLADDSYRVRGVMNGEEFTADVDSSVANVYKSVPGNAQLDGLYKIVVDTKGVITSVGNALVANVTTSATNATCTALDTKGEYATITVTSSALSNEVTYTLAKDCAVYKYDSVNKKYVKSELTDLKGKKVDLFQFKSDSIKDGIFDIVLIY